MNKSLLASDLAEKVSCLNYKDAEVVCKEIVNQMSEALVNKNRIEIRGFGSFSLHFREKQERRNPKTGESVMVDSKYFPHFKPGKELRDRLNHSFTNGVAIKESRED